jgi:hypothetical protein
MSTRTPPGPVVAFEDGGHGVADVADDGGWRDAVLFVVGASRFAATFGFVDGAALGVGHPNAGRIRCGLC